MDPSTPGRRHLYWPSVGPGGTDPRDPPEPGREPGEGAAADAGAEEELWRRWRRDKDVEARAALVGRYMPYAKSLAARLYARRVDQEAEFGDYRQFAVVGLLESMERYVPDTGAQFRTFATTRIRGAVLNGLARLTERKQQAATRRRLDAERAASVIPETLSLDAPDRLLSELGDIGVSVAIALILEGTGMNPNSRTGVGEDAYARVELRQLFQRIWALVDRLSERERTVIELHYKQLMGFEEVARTMKLTKGRISQLHRQAIEQLRTLMSKAERCDVAF